MGGSLETWAKHWKKNACIKCVTTKLKDNNVEKEGVVVSKKQVKGCARRKELTASTVGVSRKLHLQLDPPVLPSHSVGLPLSVAEEYVKQVT